MSVSQETCNSLSQVSSCSTFSSFSEQVVAPFMEKIKLMVEELKQKANESAQAASNKLENVITAVNTVPEYIRNTTIFNSKLLGANLEAVSNVLGGGTDPKDPHVTKDNIEVINYLKSKQSQLYSKVLEFAQKINQLPSEQRASMVVVFADENIRPVLQLASKAA